MFFLYFFSALFDRLFISVLRPIEFCISLSQILQKQSVDKLHFKQLSQSIITFPKNIPVTWEFAVDANALNLVRELCMLMKETGDIELIEQNDWLDVELIESKIL